MGTSVVSPEAAGPLNRSSEASKVRLEHRDGGIGVTEVFVGLAAADASGFLNQAPTWTPATAFPDGPLIAPFGDDFELRDVIRAAGLDGEPF